MLIECPFEHPGFQGLGMLTAEEDFQAVEKLCQRVKPKAVIEVGVWAGAMTLIFAKYAKRVYCVDHWQGSPGDLTLKYLDDCGGSAVAFKTFCRNMGPRLMDKVVPLIGSSALIASVWPRETKADLIYIDAGHTYQELAWDVENWLPHVRKGGTIAGHDFSPAFPGVVQAVNERFQPVRTITTGYTVDGSVWSAIVRE